MSKSFINPRMIIMLSSIGLVVMQLASLVAEVAFGRDPIYVGPFALSIIVAGAVYVAFGIINMVMSAQQSVPFHRRYLIQYFISMIIIIAAYILIPKIVPEIFDPAVSMTRAALGVG